MGDVEGFPDVTDARDLSGLSPAAPARPEDGEGGGALESGDLRRRLRPMIKRY